ncbi:Multisite-specific tRNA:(cytosine-C(5))-methyltransferase [Saitozyma sp. JCM 24511]|nr:Multisite-specific tRNA:(cytosine-C(5))-methyltransferase [Saitozyma sp. JCM 24511]
MSGPHRPQLVAHLPCFLHNTQEKAPQWQEGKVIAEAEGGDKGDDRGQWATITPEMMINEGFEEFYKAQGLLSSEEWEAFMDHLRTELPTTFRVTGSRAHAITINDLIKDKYVPTMQNVEWEGKKYPPPQQLSWYPEGLAWQISAPRRVVRKTEPFKNFQRFLVGETEVGNLSRQEAVSMIPPLLLDVEPHHLCLDMCAAPGSKTAQIIEALNPHHTESSGLLIANDSDYKRTHMLVHQTGRMPSKGLVVTNFDASLFPNISLGDENLQFDRILADVPCSGDGTMRKNIEIWKKWSAGDGNGLHGLQLRILQRAMDMLKPGGRLVYSTCSFNPAENEAVISAGLNSRPGQFSIVDVSDHLPLLKRREGITSWKVATQPEGSQSPLVYHESYAAYRERVESGEERERDKDPKRGLPETVWAPENVAELGLERCLRLFPHDQNTGGFFVCVLQKSSEAKSSAKPSVSKAADAEATPAVPVTAAAEEGESASTLKRAASPSAPDGPESKKVKQTPASSKIAKKQKRDLNFKEDPFSFVDPTNEEVVSIQNWFKLKESFPREHLLVRNEYGDPLRTIYLANAVVKAIIENNDYSRLRIISAGVKAFVRQDSQNRTEIGCKWRIPGEGVAEVLPHVGDGVVKVATIEDLRVLVEHAYPSIELFRKELRDWLEATPLGNVLMRFEAGEGAGGTMLSLRTFGEDICKPAPQRPKPTAGEDVKPASNAEAGAEAVGTDVGVEVDDGVVAGGEEEGVIFGGEEAGAEGEAEGEEAAMNA